MERSEILDKLKEIFEDLFDVDPASVVEEAKLYEDLDIDSIDAVDLIVKIREITGKKVSPEEFSTVRTVGQVLDATMKLIES